MLSIVKLLQIIKCLNIKQLIQLFLLKHKLNLYMPKTYVISSPCINCPKYPHDCKDFYYDLNHKGRYAFPVPQSYKYDCIDLVKTKETNY